MKYIILFIFFIFSINNISATMFKKVDKKKDSLSISGQKSFEYNRTIFKGDNQISNSKAFGVEKGFNQKLKVVIEGPIGDEIYIIAVLTDDKNDILNEKKFRIDINTSNFDFILGDFTVDFKGTEYTVHNKQIQGILARGKWKSGEAIVVFSNSKGTPETESFVGAGSMQEYKLKKNKGMPIIKESEKVRIDGVIQTRGIDYTIDYDDGTIMMLKVPIEETSTIKVSYEYSKDGNVYKQTFLGFTFKQHFFKKNFIGLTYLKLADKDDNQGLEGDTTSNTSKKHEVFDTHFKFNFLNHLYFDGEVAKSVIEETDSKEVKKIEGNVGKFNLGFKSKYLDSKATYSKLDPDFASIGKVLLNKELNKRSVNTDIKLHSKLKLNNYYSKAEESYTPITGDRQYSHLTTDEINNIKPIEKTAIQKRNYISYTFHQGVIAKFNNEIKLDKSTKIADKIDNKNVRNTYSLVLGGNKISSVAESINETFRNKYFVGNESKDYNKNTSHFNFAYSQSERINFKFDNSNIKTYKTFNNFLESDIMNNIANFVYNPHRKLNLKGDFSNRIEKNYVSDTDQITNVSDIRLRYKPNKKLNYTLKYKQTFKTRKLTKIVDLTTEEIENREDIPTTEVNLTEEIQKTDEIRLSEPIMFIDKSINIRYKPVKVLSTKFQYSFSDQYDIFRNDLHVKDTDKITVKIKSSFPKEIIRKYRFLNRVTSVLDYYINKGKYRNLDSLTSHSVRINKKIKLTKTMKSRLTFSGDYNIQTLEKRVKISRDKKNITGIEARKVFNKYLISRYRFSNTKQNIRIPDPTTNITNENITITNEHNLLNNISMLDNKMNLSINTIFSKIKREHTQTKTDLITNLDYSFDENVRANINYKITKANNSEPGKGAFSEQIFGWKAILKF